MITGLLTRDKNLEDCLELWKRQWPTALLLWNRFTQLTEPRWCLSQSEEKKEGLTDSFAMIRLQDHAVVISLRKITELKLEKFGLEILGHEIGHHIYCPADLTDHGRVLTRIRTALPSKEHLASFVANLYEDLLINDRLHRSEKLNIAGVYQVLRGDGPGDKLWTLYMRIYEILWKLKKGSLAVAEFDSQLDLDAQLGARLIRHYAKHWLEGSGRFATLCLTYLLEDEATQMQEMLKAWRDTDEAGAGGMPTGLSEIEQDEREGAIHPALDDELTGMGDEEELEEDEDESAGKQKSETDNHRGAAPLDVYSTQGNSEGQYREPFEFGEILKSLGISLTDEEIAIRYYRERAIPHLIRFPTRDSPESKEPLAEGLEVWDVSSPIDRVDWFESIVSSPYVIPGVTTVERYYGTTAGSMPERIPVDLDLYVDSSGSMPNPRYQTSYLTLAGAIVALSALRVGSRVQATLWSGTRQFLTTNGFVSDEHDILRVLTGYFGGATAFPIHILRDTFGSRRADARPVHILVISDDGVTTMFDRDEKGNSGWDITKTALEKARGGGTLLLNLWNDWHNNRDLRTAFNQGWQIHRVQNWEDLVQFAREFSKETYGEKETKKRGAV